MNLLFWRPIPGFAALVSAAMALLGFVFAFGFFIDPQALLKDLDTTQPAVQGLAFTLGTRSLAMALALGAALLWRSREALLVVLGMRVVTETLDLINLMSRPYESPVAIVILVLILCEVAAMTLLWRARRPQPAIRTVNGATP